MVATKDDVEPYGLWLLLRNPSDDVEQNAFAVDHLLLIVVLLVRFACLGPSILLLLVAQLSLSLSMLTSGSSSYFLNLMTNDELDGGLLMTTDG